MIKFYDKFFESENQPFKELFTDHTFTHKYCDNNIISKYHKYVDIQKIAKQSEKEKEEDLKFPEKTEKPLKKCSSCWCHGRNEIINRDFNSLKHPEKVGYCYYKNSPYLKNTDEFKKYKENRQKLKRIFNDFTKLNKLDNEVVEINKIKDIIDDENPTDSIERTFDKSLLAKKEEESKKEFTKKKKIIEDKIIDSSKVSSEIKDIFLDLKQKATSFDQKLDEEIKKVTENKKLYIIKKREDKLNALKEDLNDIIIKNSNEKLDLESKALNEISKNEKIEDLNLTYKSLEKEKYFILNKILKARKTTELCNAGDTSELVCKNYQIEFIVLIILFTLYVNYILKN